MLGDLDGKGTNTARTGMDQNFVAFFEITLGDQRLPRGQASQRDRGRLFMGNVSGLDRQFVFLNARKFCNGTSIHLVGAGEHLIANFDAFHILTNLNNCA